MTSTHETEITADPIIPAVRIVREFDAPPDKVFRATPTPSCWPGGSCHGAPR